MTAPKPLPANVLAKAREIASTTEYRNRYQNELKDAAEAMASWLYETKIAPLERVVEASKELREWFDDEDETWKEYDDALRAAGETKGD